MKKYTRDEIKKIAIEKYGKDYEMLQGQINWFIKGFREALSQHDVSKSFYCQSEIETDDKCDNQCDHCKEYYKPLEQ